MKSTKHPFRGSLLSAGSLPIVLACVMAAFGAPDASAEVVDTELLLLVDVGSGGLKKGEFASLMDNYANSFSSSQVLDSIQSGARGQIAISLIYFGGNQTQAVGIPWMTIGSAAEGLAFADALRALVEPASGSFSYSDALALGTRSFGSETGNVANGYESAVQIIQVAAATKPSGSSTDIQTATDTAFASGIDMISATTVGTKAASLEAYYAANVVGGSVGSQTGSVTTSPIDPTLSNALTAGLTSDIQASAGASAVPEPSSAVLFISTVGFLTILRRNRRP